MLTLIDVRKEYGEGESAVTALRGVSVSFRENEFVSILGPSGCGKTTLLNIVGGLDQYTSGDLVIRGVSTRLYRDADWDAYRNHSVGFVFQSYNLIPHQSVLANVELALTLSGVSKAERTRRATEALVRVGLGDQIKKRPNQLSGGQMQRVAIARALVNDPDVLLADEPTGALDTETSLQVMDLLREVAREKLVVMVTHNPDLAEKYSTRIIRLLDGEIVGDTDLYLPASEPAAVPAENPAPTETLPAGGQKEPRRKKIKKAKKRSMSLLTALSLSLNNLLTKKGRTFLTSFAGSIGIIGIALILALSNGINLYITRVQEDSLSSYPITINREEADLMSMISSLSNLRENKTEHEIRDGNVYGYSVFENLITTLFSPAVNENNLTAFKRYLDGGALDGVDATVQYGYDIPLTVYVSDANGNYAASDVYSLMSEMGGSFSDGETASASSYSYSSSFASFSVWSEMLGGKNGEPVADLTKEQYDLVAGEWPQAPGDVMVVVNDRDEVNDLVLFALGLRSRSEMEKILDYANQGSGSGSDEEAAPVERWRYEEILGRTFRTIAPANLYQKNGDGRWENVSGQQEKLNSALSDDARSLEMRVCGILRLNPDAVAAEGNSGLLYTRDLTKYLIEATAKSEIVQEQIKTPGINVLTGRPYPKNVTAPADKEAEFRAYIDGMTNREKAAFLEELLTTHYNPATKNVVHLNRRILTAVRQVRTAVGSDRAKITAWVNENCPAYADTIAAIEDDAKLRAAFERLVWLRIPQALQEQGEALYANYRNAPAAGEVDARVAAITADASTPEEIREAKEGYVVGVYLASTEVSQDALETWVTGLSNEELDGTFSRLVLAEIAADPTVTEETKDARCAAVLDGIVAGWNQTKAATAYTYFITNGTAGTSYEGTLAKLYVYDEDAPSRISIYVSTFAEKDKVTAVIAEYNKTAAEEDEITYTDVMSLLMTSITYILNAVTYVLVAFVSVSLVVSSIMIGIITYISVLERTKEIGILRAIGASKRDVSRVFNAETLIIGFAAGLIGIVVTLLFCIPINLILRALTGIGNIAAVLPIGGGIALVLISMGLTLLAGLIPSRMASKKDPVVALRTE